MKLHVGCGKRFLRGYKHQDLIKYEHVDYVAPSWQCPLDDNTFDEVYARHLLEHLYPHHAEATIKEWRRILTDDGKLHIIVPNIEFHMKQFFLPGRSEYMHRNASNRDHAMAGFYGWLTPATAEFMAHRFGYTPETLVALVKKYFLKTELINQHILHEVNIVAWGRNAN